MSLEPAGAKLDREAARGLLARPGVAKLLACLDGDGEETRIVGGAVRNALIGRPVHEVDLATTALPRDTMRRAAKAGLRTVPTGIEHGTVTILTEAGSFEVTTLRQDVETDGRHAVVRFGRDFAGDALRRDFTVNALSLDRAGQVIDVTGGLDDLAAGRIRFIGDPAIRIREDYLRVLRFFRFHAEYGVGPVDRPGLDAAIMARDGLARLSRERVRTELLKLLTAPRGAETALLLQGCGLLGRLTAGVGDTGRLARIDPEGCGPVRRLAGFLVRTAEDARRLKAELRLSNADEALLAGYAAALARMVSRTRPVDAAEARRLVVLHGVDATRDALRATAGESRPVISPDGRAALDGYLGGRVALPRFGLTGRRLMAEGVTEGPELGRRLAEARATWIEAGCPDDA